MLLKLVFTCLSAGFIGWFTNWIAVKMLFHPKDPKRILGITFQGIFPKRQRQFAQQLGHIVSTELISFDDIQSKLINPTNIAKAMPMIKEKLDGFIKSKLKEKMPLISMFVSDDTINDIKENITVELASSLPDMLRNFSNQMKGELNIEQMVTEKVSAFSSDKLEEILIAIMKKEFRFVEIIGGIIGVLVGLMSFAVNTWLLK